MVSIYYSQLIYKKGKSIRVESNIISDTLITGLMIQDYLNNGIKGFKFIKFINHGIKSN